MLRALPCLLMLSLPVGTLHADESEQEAPPQPDKPWVDGVSADKQAEALRHYDTANRLVAQNQCGKALVHYRRALGAWDHPGIRYNMAICLIDIKGEPARVHDHLLAAIRFGAAPIGDDKFKEAKRYLQLLRGQLGQVTIACTEPQAEVALDGKPLFSCPGRRELLLGPGLHTIIATKAGYLPTSRSLQLRPGSVNNVELELLKDIPPRLERRWQTWKPWTVVGAGAALALSGIPLALFARNNSDDFDAALTQLCPVGCPSSDLPSSLRKKRDRAELQNTLAIAAFAAGGAAVATGIALVILNKPQSIERSPVVPTITPSGVALLGRF